MVEVRKPLGFAENEVYIALNFCVFEVRSAALQIQRILISVEQTVCNDCLVAVNHKRGALRTALGFAVCGIVEIVADSHFVSFEVFTRND